MKFSEFLEGKSITQEDFAKKDAEEMAGLYNEYNEKKAEALEAAIEAKATKEDIDAMKAEIGQSITDQVKKMNDVLIAQGVAIKAIAKGGEEAKSVTKSVRDVLAEQSEELAKIKDERGVGGKGAHKVSFETKTMTITGSITGGNVPVEQRIQGLDYIPVRPVTMLDVVSRGTATSNVISWVSQTNKTGVADYTAEATLKNEVEFDLVVVNESVKKFTAFTKVSEEMITDVDFIETAIRTDLNDRLLRKVEQQVYEGNDSATQLNGIKTIASSFVAATAPEAVQNANALDVLVTSMTQLLVANQPAASHIFMNPIDVLGLKNKKVGSTDDRYIDRLIDVSGQLMLDGVPIIQTNLVTQDDYLVGFFPYATVYDKGSIRIEVGRSGDDFVNNIVTILAEWRGLNLVETNKRGAFIKGVFSTDKAALEAL